MSELYLVWSIEHDAWWGPGGHGYVRELSRAARYTHEQAIKICVQSIPGDADRMGQFPEIPVRLADMEALTASYRALELPGGEPWED